MSELAEDREIEFRQRLKVEWLIPESNLLFVDRSGGFFSSV